MTTRADVFEFRLLALASQAKEMAGKLEELASRRCEPNDAIDAELRAIESSFDVNNRLRIRDLYPKMEKLA